MALLAANHTSNRVFIYLSSSQADKLLSPEFQPNVKCLADCFIKLNGVVDVRIVVGPRTQIFY
jgi:hypothetical protein